MPGAGELLALAAVVDKEVLGVRHMTEQGSLNAVVVEGGQRRFAHLPLGPDVSGVRNRMGQRRPRGGLFAVVGVIAAHDEA